MTQVSTHTRSHADTQTAQAVARSCADVFGATVVENADTAIISVLQERFPRVELHEYVAACQMLVMDEFNAVIDEKDRKLYGRPLNLAFMARIIRAYDKWKVVRKHKALEQAKRKGQKALPAAKKGNSNYWPERAGMLHDNRDAQISTEPIYRLMHHANMIAPNVDAVTHKKLSTASRRAVRLRCVEEWRRISDKCRPVNGYEAIVQAMANGAKDEAIRIEFRRRCVLHVIRKLKAEGMSRTELVNILIESQNTIDKDDN